MIGSASLAWGPTRTWNSTAPTWEVRGTFVGSYGLNGWLRRMPGSGDTLTEIRSLTIDLPARNASAVPIFADAIEDQGMPRDTDDVPVNLEHPIPESGPGVVGPRGQMAYFCIDRHRLAVNVVFLDGHAARVPLKDLWKLEWNRGFKARDVAVPAP
jgi:prepilin-type processing-associated H-X9-DG protein